MNLGLLFGVLFVLAAGGSAYFWWSLGRRRDEIAGEADRLNASCIAEGHAGSERGARRSWRERRVNAIERPDQGQGKPIYLLDAMVDTAPARSLAHPHRGEGGTS